MAAPSAPPFERFVTRDVTLGCGVVLPEATLAFRALAFGREAADRDGVAREVSAVLGVADRA